jgi:hypothetical protein
MQQQIERGLLRSTNACVRNTMEDAVQYYWRTRLFAVMNIFECVGTKLIGNFPQLASACVSLKQEAQLTACDLRFSTTWVRRSRQPQCREQQWNIGSDFLRTSSDAGSSSSSETRGGRLDRYEESWKCLFHSLDQ